MFLHRSDLNIPAKLVKHFGVFNVRNAKTFSIFSNFVAIFADLNDICQDFLRFYRKCRKTLRLLEIYRFHSRFNFQIDLIFNRFYSKMFDLIFTEPPPSRRDGSWLLCSALPRGEKQNESTPAFCMARPQRSLRSFCTKKDDHLVGRRMHSRGDSMM